jgi:glycosyltransferase involved in cell wall biosynthesis
MHQVLYITPYFPPQSQVGALRPLKFVRHLPQLGWLPVVLTDLWPGAAVDPALRDAVPPEVPVIHAYSRRAGPALRELQTHGPRPKRTPNGRDRLQARVLQLLPHWLNNPELIPLGEHGIDIPHALKAARHALEDHPGCEAILVNADPFAACLVGAQLKHETGLPLVLDLRDPWAPCRLRRPRRPAPMRWLEDKLERWCVETADHVILNTRHTLDDYRAHYADLPPEHFSFLRNHFDAQLSGSGRHPGFDRFTLLHLGRFTRFRTADGVLQMLAELQRRGIGPEHLQLAVTGDPGEAAWKAARALGVDDYLRVEGHVSYRKVGAVMAAADVLLMLAEPGAVQRIASKYYDYLGSERPVLAITDNPEAVEIMEQSGAGRALGYGDVAALADAVQAEMALGRQRTVARRPIGVTSREATEQLVAILESVVRAPAAGGTA